MEKTESGEEKLPVHESINVFEHIRLYKTEKWWAEIVLCEAFGGRNISLYQWQNRKGTWKRQSKWKIRNKADWLALRDAVDRLILKL